MATTLGSLIQASMIGAGLTPGIIFKIPCVMSAECSCKMIQAIRVEDGYIFRLR